MRVAGSDATDRNRFSEKSRDNRAIEKRGENPANPIARGYQLPKNSPHF
jgi:hypothetical protein